MFSTERLTEPGILSRPIESVAIRKESFESTRVDTDESRAAILVTKSRAMAVEPDPPSSTTAANAAAPARITTPATRPSTRREGRRRGAATGWTCQCGVPGTGGVKGAAGAPGTERIERAGGAAGAGAGSNGAAGAGAGRVWGGCPHTTQKLAPLTHGAPHSAQKRTSSIALPPLAESPAKTYRTSQGRGRRRRTRQAEADARAAPSAPFEYTVPVGCESPASADDRRATTPG